MDLELTSGTILDRGDTEEGKGLIPITLRKSRIYPEEIKILHIPSILRAPTKNQQPKHMCDLCSRVPGEVRLTNSTSEFGEHFEEGVAYEPALES